MSDYEWIKKLAKDKEKEKKKEKTDYSDYVDEEKKEEVAQSFKDRFKKLKEKIYGK